MNAPPDIVRSAYVDLVVTDLGRAAPGGST